jgi:hypothetical protein
MEYRLPNSYEKTLKQYPNVDLTKTSVNNNFHNYDDTEDNYSIDIGLRYGDMPSEALMQKFDESNIEADDYQPLEVLDDHWRSTLKDLSAQPTSLESDYRRTDNQSASFLNWRYRGTRGNSDVEVHQPEMFLGFHGEEDREPRGGFAGTNPLEPDFKEFTKQNQARLKYLRFTPDASLNVTGLGRTQAKVQADDQKLFRALRNQLNWFDTSFDGRKNGISMTGGINPESIVYQQTGLDENYNDYIKQVQTDRRNKTTILSNKLFRNSNAYNQFTTDHQFKVASYGANPQRFRPYFPLESRIMQVDTENELAYPEEQSLANKTASMLMGQVILQRHKAEQDVSRGESSTAVVSKTKRQEQEIKSVLQNLTTDTEKSESTETGRKKSSRQTPHKSGVNTSQEDQEKKQSIGVKMYKTATGSQDYVKGKFNINQDQSESSSISIDPHGKNRKMDKHHSNVNDVIHMTSDGVSLESTKYKSSARKQLNSVVDSVNRDGTSGPDVSVDRYGQTAPRMANVSRSDDVVTQDAYSEQVLDSQRLRSHRAAHGEKSASASHGKSEQNTFERF